MDGDKYARRFQRTDSSMWRGILLNQKLCGLARSGIGRPRPTSAAGAGTQHVAFFSNSQFCTQNSPEFRLGHTAIFSFAHFARGFLIFNVFSRQPILTASSASGSRFPLGQNPEICPSGKDSCEYYYYHDYDIYDSNSPTRPSLTKSVTISLSVLCYPSS